MALDILSYLMGQKTGGGISLNGRTEPTADDGKNGDIYLQWKPDGDSNLGWYCAPSYLCTEVRSIGVLNGRNYWKTKPDAAIVLWCKVGTSIQPHMASTSADGVILQADTGGPWGYTASFVIDGVTWYFQQGNHGFTYGTPSSDFPIDLSISWDFSTQAQAEEFLTLAGVTFTTPVSIPHTITNALVKVDGSWQNLIGSHMSDVG